MSIFFLARTLATILYLRSSSYHCSSCSYTMLRPPSPPFKVLGQTETAVHAVNDIFSGNLSSPTASAPLKNALAVTADPKGQVSRLEPSPSKSCPAPWSALWSTAGD